MTERSGIAVVGMSCIFPGAPDLDAYWRNIEGGVDAIADVPAGRWDPLFYDPSSDAADRFYCRRGGFVDAYAIFDALGFGIMPVAAQGAEPDQLLVLQAAARALADAGYDDRAFPRERTGVVLGRGNYIGAGMTRLEQHVRTAEQLVLALRTLVPGLTDGELGAVKAEFQKKLGAYGPDTAIGLVPNLTASRITNRLDLYGPAYTVDAACASALVAVDGACRELRDGRADMMLAGGVHLSHDVAFWSVFCQLGALSRTQQIRPFDRRADGLLIGEGLGVLVLKREDDAERDGDRIYAVIRGTGVASDGRDASLMTPRIEGQLLALKRAWGDAALDPATIGLVEAHGTGTPVGDAAELETLGRFFGTTEGARAGLGSVKSMIGHAMPAAGAAGLIKAVLATYHGVLPPTLHCEEPQDGLARTRFRVLSRAEPWEGPARRAAVNAFGFGGINAHVVLDRVASPARKPRDEGLLVLASDSKEGLLAALETRQTGRGHWRLAVVDPTPSRIARARGIVEAGTPRHGRDGLHFAPGGLIGEGGKVALLFPGVEAAFEPRVDDVARHFGLPAPLYAKARDLEERGAGVIEVGRLLHHALDECGVHADAVAGHSIGEWNAMLACGLIPEAWADRFIASLEKGSLEVPGVVFAAVGCGAEKARGVLGALDGIAVSHDNCPHQSVLCGREGRVAEALDRLRRERVLCQVLPFRSGFHSPLFEDYAEPHRRHFHDMPVEAPKTPIWSATVCAPFPADPEDVRALAGRHLVEPVRFRELILAMWDQGFRVFVQVGTGNLVGFVSDTLQGRPHMAISANARERSGLAQLRRAVAALYVQGADVNLERVGLRPKAAKGKPVTLALGVPLVSLDTPLTRAPSAAAAPAGPSSPVLDELARSMGDIAAAQSAVVQALSRGRPKPRDITIRRTLSVSSDPALLDHCFFRQPPRWPGVADRYPVVPMTMSVAMMLAAAREVAPGVPIAVERVRAAKWLAVEPPVEATIRATFDGASRVSVAIAGHIEATVVMAPGYPAPPAPTPVAANEAPEVTAEALYDDRWMFHGPAYQGIVALTGMGEGGIRGRLRALPAEGALLDNAGQLFGYWIMARTTVDRLAMPVKVERIAFYGPEPAPGAELDCAVHVRHVGRREVRADLELVRDGRVHCRIEGWEDWRFDTDDRLWPVMRFPERHLFAEPHQDGYVVLADAGRSVPSRDYLARRFLSERERAEMDALGEARRAEWLSGRIAAKDAVRHWLWTRGHGPIFPVEIAVRSEPSGRPVVSGPYAADLRVSIAHKAGVAVAIVSEGQDPGIDVETIEPRSDRFAELAFTPAEQAMLAGQDRAEWLTRLWCAKEAVGKARGTGLAGAPKRLLLSEVDGERLRVDGVFVETRVQSGRVVAWTAGV